MFLSHHLRNATCSELRSLGKNSARKGGLHGAETNSFVTFLHAAMLPQYRGHLKERACHHDSACDALVTTVGIIRAHKFLVPVPDQARFCEAVQNFLEAMKSLGAPLKPKLHLFIDMAGRLATHGSPALVDAWADESRNVALKRTCAGHTVLYGMPESLLRGRRGMIA